MARTKLTTLEFITKAKLVHGPKYDYSDVTYVKSNIPVNIYCEQHGTFSQRPNAHLRGSGCQFCGAQSSITHRTKSADLFISQSNKMHNHKYNYDNVVYTNTRTKLLVTCNKHGNFSILPKVHLRGIGCNQCNKVTTNDFIAKANIAHMGRYSYCNTIYVNNKTLIKITCDIHGDFEQTPASHLRGSGCPNCATAYRTSDVTTFITHATNIHDNYYSYPNINYVNNRVKVDIVCPKHGTFNQRPNDHLSGLGCMQCGGRAPLDTIQFIQRAQQIHQSKYDYSRVQYTNITDKVSIVCKNHGIFQQSPHTHLSGAGCWDCRNLALPGKYDLNRLATDKELGQSIGYVYLISMCSIKETFTKVGITVNVAQRLRSMSSDYNVTQIAEKQCTLLEAYKIEQQIQQQYSNYVPKIKFGGYTECLNVPDSQRIQIIKEYGFTVSK